VPEFPDGSGIEELLKLLVLVWYVTEAGLVGRATVRLSRITSEDPLLVTGTVTVTVLLPAMQLAPPPGLKLSEPRTVLLLGLCTGEREP